MKTETPQSRASNPPKRDGGASRGEVNNGRHSQGVIIPLREKPQESLMDAGSILI